VTPAPRPRSGLHRAYVATVFVLGLAALVDALYTLHVTRVPYQWIGLGLLAIFSNFVSKVRVPGLTALSLSPVKVQGRTAHMSPSETLLFLIVLLFGGAPAIATLALDGLTFSFKQEWKGKRKDKSPTERLQQAAFGLGEPILSVWVAAAVYFGLAGIEPLWVRGASVAQIGLPALAMSAVYFVMNSGLSALAEAGASGKPPLPLWRTNLKNYFFDYVSAATIALVLAVNLASANSVDGLKSLVVIAPLIYLPYYIQGLLKGQNEEKDRHVAEVEQINLKSAEALATMAEAKDRATTLGHIRRVKKFTTLLARTMGIRDAKELKAIEFAGLLHDTGKALIKEHILNKPGKLSADEYEIVKTHASIGADIVSTIGYTFPVVPIVRHHHENWDGTGYPDGLQAEAIPVGARVLSVVDCYDALRSHRPYRRALSAEQAMAIIRERRGTMYDPAVVDAFLSIQATIETEAVDDPLPEVLDRFATAAREMRRPDPASAALPLELRLAATDMVLRLYEHLSALGSDAGIDVTCDTVSRCLLRLAPAGLIVFYRRDDAADEVVTAYASGFCEALVRDVRMPLGHGVSGWVAANGRSVINADSALDLGHRLDGIAPEFRSVLSIPLSLARGTVGVITLYASQAQAFREEQRQAIELISGPIADAFARALKAHPDSVEQPLLFGLPGTSNGPALHGLLARDKRLVGEFGQTLGVLCVRNFGDTRVMAHATMAVNQATRIADLIFRPADDSLVVLMPDSDASAGELVLERIAAAMPPDIVPPPSESSPLRVGFACSPHDGDSVRVLLDVAQLRLGEVPVAAVAPARPAPLAPVRGHGGPSCQA